MIYLEAIELKKKLENLELKGYNKFILYAISTNISKLTEIEEKIKEADKARYTQDIISFEQKRIDEMKRCGEYKDDELVIQNGRVSISEDKKLEFAETMSQLHEEYSDVLKKFEEESRAFDELLKSDVGISFVKYSWTHLPETMDGAEYKLLSTFVRESEEDIAALAL